MGAIRQTQFAAYSTVRTFWFSKPFCGLLSSDVLFSFSPVLFDCDIVSAAAVAMPVVAVGDRQVYLKKFTKMSKATDCVVLGHQERPQSHGMSHAQLAVNSELLNPIQAKVFLAMAPAPKRSSSAPQGGTPGGGKAGGSSPRTPSLVACSKKLFVHEKKFSPSFRLQKLQAGLEPPPACPRRPQLPGSFCSCTLNYLPQQNSAAFRWASLIFAATNSTISHAAAKCGRKQLQTADLPISSRKPPWPGITDAVQ